MEAAWWEKKQRERAEADRRAREEATRRAHDREGGASAEHYTGWRPPVVTPPPPPEMLPLTSSRGFLRELPRRLVRLALLVVAAYAAFVTVFSLESDGDFPWLLVALVALVLIFRLRPGRRGSMEGVATHVTAIPGGGGAASSLSFRLERYDSRGARMTPIPIEMKGGDLKGQLFDGDEVRTIGGRVRGGALHPRQLVNLRTGKRVHMGRRVGYWIQMSIVWALLAAIGVFVVLALTS